MAAVSMRPHTGAGPIARYIKLQEALTHIGITETLPFDGSELSRWNNVQTAKEFEAILKYMDPGKTLSRYATWDSQKLILYRDRDTKLIPDFSLSFRPEDVAKDPNHLILGLGRVFCDNCSRMPLAGVRIALDPGHMGGPAWDPITGKFVKSGKKLVSEGTLALRTCQLLAQDLRAMGAIVLLTRTDLEPVTKLDYKTYDLAPYAIDEMLQSTDDTWTDGLLDQSGTLEATFAGLSVKFTSLKAETKRAFYFTNRADLAARAAVIDNFDPHLTLILHFDARDNFKLQSENKEIRGYIEGNIMNGELAARKDRYLIVRHLMDDHRWWESKTFTARVVQALSKATGRPLRVNETDTGAIKITDGVYARNLALSRLISKSATAYVEALVYDYVDDFDRLKVNNRTAQADGIRFDYPARLDDVVKGLREGILTYVQSFEPGLRDSHLGRLDGRPKMEERPLVRLQ